MPEQRNRHRHAERVPIVAAELRRLGRSATRKELFENLKTEPGGLFEDQRHLNATFRYDQRQPQPVFVRDGKDRIALRNPADTVREIEYGPQESKVYERGQTVVPKMIREALAVEEGTTLMWQVKEGMAQVVAIPQDPVGALRGILKGKGPTFEEYLADRNAERQRERELEADEERRWRTYSTRQR